MKNTSILVLALCLCLSNSVAQEIYFPPATGTWERVTPASLNWCQDRVDSLVSYVGATHGKALIILKNGRIALEQYYGSFTRDSIWYWASAGKTVTSVLTGLAQEEGLLDITKPSATYLNYGWSSCTKQQEEQITVRHHLTMTTGLGFERDSDNCTRPECLTFRAAPGTIWDYHNAAYLLLQDMVAKASGMTYQQYYNRKLSTKLGMGGLWYSGILYSKPLAMARFGLFLLAGGVWNGDTIMHDRSYFNAMINTSQDLNKSYGYLFWLNGKGSYLQPQIPLTYTTDLVPSAPKDMYAGMGKNDQRVYVVPSQGLVVVRMGDKATESLPAISGFDDELWKRVNALVCATDVSESSTTPTDLWPNPALDELHFNGEQLDVYSIDGIRVASSTSTTCSLSGLPIGIYYAVVRNGNSYVCRVIQKQ